MCSVQNPEDKVGRETETVSSSGVLVVLTTDSGSLAWVGKFLLCSARQLPWYKSTHHGIHPPWATLSDQRGSTGWEDGTQLSVTSRVQHTTRPFPCGT